MAGYSASIWADPDVGKALFYVVLEPGKPAPAAQPTSVRISLEPVSGRVPVAVYEANRQRARGHLRYVARPALDQAEIWRVGVNIRMSDGSTHDLEAAVEATPPGLGPWDIALYLMPFVLFGGLWVLAFVSRSRRRGSAPRAMGSHHAEAGENAGGTGRCMGMPERACGGSAA